MARNRTRYSQAIRQIYQAIAWSPTGQRLAYIEVKVLLRNAEVTIETCDLAGGARTVVLSDPDLWGSERNIWRLLGCLMAVSFTRFFPRATDSDLWAITCRPEHRQAKRSGRTCGRLEELSER